MPKVLFLSQCWLLAIVLRESDDVAGQFTAPPPTCPDDTFTFRCSVTGDRGGVTIWRVDGGSNQCTLSPFSTSRTICGPQNAFTATPETEFGTNATSFTSTLSGTASPTLNGTLVECFGPLISVDTGNRVNGSTLWILGPPSIPTLSCVELSGGVSGTVNVTVSWALSGGDSADFYLINITTDAPQTPYGGLLNITTASVTQHELTGFMAGYEYDITVRGVNCGIQGGRESEPLTIRPQVPAVSSSCQITLSYNQSSGRLLFINSTWDTVPDPVDPGEACPGPSGNITQYQISFHPGSSMVIVNVNIARCTAGRCSHTFEPPSNPPSSYDSVSVAAENVVGVGTARTCTTQPIGTANNLLTEELADLSSSSNVKLNCTFLSGFTGSAHCTVQYGTDPTYMNLPYSAESTETGTAGDTVSVVLRERLNSSTVYYYTVSAVSGDVTVTVQGTFTTPQYTKYLNKLTTASQDPNQTVSSSNAGTIVGGAVGGVAAAAIVVALAIGGVIVVKRSKKKSDKDLKSEKTEEMSHNGREEFNMVLAPLPEHEEKRMPPGSQYVDVQAVHRNTNPPPILDDRVQYSDVLPQKTHVTFVSNKEPPPPPLPHKLLEVATQKEDNSELSKSGGSVSRKVIEPVDCQCQGLPEVSSYFVAPAEESSFDDDEVQVTQEIIEGLVLFQCTAETTKGKDVLVSGAVIHGTAHQDQAKQSACEQSQALPDSIILKSVVS